MSRFLRKKRDKTLFIKRHNSPNHRTNWCQITERVYFAYGLDKKKKVAEISLSDQILLFIVQREAIVDITGTLQMQR